MDTIFSEEVMEMAGFVPIFFDWTEVTEALNDAEKGRLVDALVTYAKGGSWNDLIKGNERYVFPVFRAMIDRSAEISAKRSQAGSNGGKQSQANRSKPKQTEASTTEEEEEEEKEKEEEYKKREKEKRFRAPTVEEVREYCRERNNRVDPERFVDFYAGKGWRVGSSPMKDWKACVRTWEARDGRKTGGNDLDEIF